MAPPSVRLEKTETELAQAFRQLSSPQDLADLLEVPFKTLSFYVYKKHNYREFTLTKRGGGFRHISTPSTSLLLIQKKLAQVLAAVYGTRGPVHGFVRKRSIKTNARRHLGARWLLNFDLKDFFPSIHYGRVAGLFAGKAYALPESVASLIARISCYKASLPVGAPTSPIIANMICAKLDAELKALAWASGCTYTRYADDISVSTKAEAFSPDIVVPNPSTKNWVLGEKIVNIVQANTFDVNPYKTRVRSDHSGQHVTGIRINNRSLNVSKALVSQLRAMLHAWEKYGEAPAAKEYHEKYKRKQTRNAFPDFKQVVRGKVEFLGHIQGRDHHSYVRLIHRLQKLHPEASVQSIRVESGTRPSVTAQAIWLMENRDSTSQGTAFAVSGKHLVTAAHVLDDFMFASQPSLSNEKYMVTELWRDEDLDIAICEITVTLPVHLSVCSVHDHALGSKVCVVGFPNHHIYDTVAFRHGQVVQKRTYLGNNDYVDHLIVDADIVKGNSGGPILDAANRVIGVAVKGLDIPGKLGDNDQLSSYVPVDRVLLAAKCPQLDFS